MRKIVLTCVACGRTKAVWATPEEMRDAKCSCSASMVEKRQPGSVL